MELPDTKTIKLKWPEGYEMDFKTGQFITIYWPDTPSILAQAGDIRCRPARWIAAVMKSR